MQVVALFIFRCCFTAAFILSGEREFSLTRFAEIIVTLIEPNKDLFQEEKRNRVSTSTISL